MRYRNRRHLREELAEWPRLACYDPGADYCAQAVFDVRSATLLRARLTTIEDLTDTECPAVIECPEKNWRVEKGTLACARGAGEIGGQHSGRLYVSPAEWKGSIPKKTHHAHHILPRLTASEFALLPRKQSDLVHVLDAVGIGLWFFGRLRKG